ncbi:TIM barrel protein [Verticiella sediminum]|uniref:TIM barrel protein n=1 Tax=Verticiella sediminum TaxID=1247510 RepID=A0A556AZE7_9BURK|nr:TIM barrel protein [Verticiella sediminum]TSH98311.1 TIM barrel protein [Verticiella sediminum]
MKLSANLSLLYADRPLAERIHAAARDGFAGVEIQSPYDLPADVLATHLRQAGTSLVLINTPPGAGGEAGLAALPGREAEFATALQRALAVCAATGCPRIHVMAGKLPGGADPVQAREVLLANLRRAAPRAAEHGVVLTLEALNRHDVPGYFYHQPREAAAIVQALADPAVGLQFDFYHCQREGLDVDAELAAVLPWVRHVQFAHAVGRREPDPAAPAVAAALRRLAASGYAGWLGAEYVPAGDTTAGLGWRAQLERVLAG